MATPCLIGSSAKFRALLRNVEVVAPVDSAILIQGETGSASDTLSDSLTRTSKHSNPTCGECSIISLPK